MAIYTEKNDKLNLRLSNSANPVKIKLDCYKGTLGSISYDTGRIKTINCGETGEVGEASFLKSKSVEFSGSFYNPDNNSIKVTVTIFENGGNSETYAITDDYSGTPDFDNSDENPTFKFNVNFE